jgi:hypothetical protein
MYVRPAHFDVPKVDLLTQLTANQAAQRSAQGYYQTTNTYYFLSRQGVLLKQTSVVYEGCQVIEMPKLYKDYPTSAP